MENFTLGNVIAIFLVLLIVGAAIFFFRAPREKTLRRPVSQVMAKPKPRTRAEVDDDGDEWPDEFAERRRNRMKVSSGLGQGQKRESDIADIAAVAGLAMLASESSDARPEHPDDPENPMNDTFETGGVLGGGGFEIGGEDSSEGSEK